jgi:hypothetical protein
MERRGRLVEGFTLVETMVAGGLFISLGLIATVWFTGVSDLWWTTTVQSEVRTEAQHAVNRVVSELRSATRSGGGSPPNLIIPAAPDNTAVILYLPADQDANGLIIDAVGTTEWGTLNPIQYSYAPQPRELQRTEGGQVRVIATDVSAVTFEDSAIDPALYADQVRITVTLRRKNPQGRTLEATATEVVTVRN